MVTAMIVFLKTDCSSRQDVCKLGLMLIIEIVIIIVVIYSEIGNMSGHFENRRQQ